MKQRYKKNDLLGINSLKGWIDKMELVKEEIKNHFHNRFCETISKKLNLDGVTFEQLTLEVVLC